MNDLREKVIVELTAEIEDASHCRHCGLAVTMENALSLLKEQEPKTAKEILNVGGHLMGKCPRCSKILTVQDHPVACGFCGQAVKWE